MRHQSKHRHSDPETGQLIKSYPFDVICYEDPVLPALVGFSTKRDKRFGTRKLETLTRLCLMADSDDLRAQWMEQIERALDDYHKVRPERDIYD